MNNNNLKSDSICAFGETLVSVLYGEATRREIQDFESHLSGCLECREEFAAFGTLRNAVSEWRNVEFTPLALPNVVLPVETRTIEPALTETPSLFEKLRCFFTSANFGWQISATSFAVLIIFGFLFFGTFNFFKTKDNNVSVSPTINATPESAAAPLEVVAANDETTATPEETPHVIAQNREKTQKGSNRNNRKATKQSTNNSADRNGDLPKRRIMTPKSQPKEELSNLLDDEPEEDSVRLTDLLDEIEPSI
ncbi:MAG: hypothetical protein M3209_00910 [Acidobacteriota bacterium]|nr:hypothetical protein [Acidobacteriota bacterium]